MSHKYLQELIKNLQEFYKCPTCDTNYYFDDIKFLGQVDAYSFVQLSCHYCSLPVLASISSDNYSLPKKRKRSDLRSKEHSKFVAKGAITADEIASFHLYISTFQDSLANLNSKH